MIEKCSRKASREVRKLVYSSDIIQFGATHEHCRFKAKNDLFYDQEIHKQRITRIDWKCKYCGKHFKSEHYIDKHMWLKHSDSLSVSFMLN